MNYDKPELLDKLAAAYVFGTLSSRARRRFTRLRRTLPAADAAVLAWEARTAGLSGSVAPVAPSSQVWQGIERRLDGARPAAHPRRWWQPALGFAFGVFAVVALLRLNPPGIDAVLPPQAEVPTKGYVGILLDEAGVPTVLASSSRHGRHMFVSVKRPVAVPAGKVLQLWALPDNAAAFPLGTVQPEGQTVFEMDGTSEELLAKVTRLGVSIEDAPAAAGDTPSAFVVSGHCVKLW
ncbi:MAG: anti-sigma factor [Pseudazoarcus pumilus]|nr:anti-sigma factor [Pseudazoarcus pumilus]